MLFCDFFFELALNVPDELHGHIRLIHNSAFKRQRPQITVLAVYNGQKDIDDITEPFFVLNENFTAISSVKNLRAKTVYFSLVLL